MDQGNFFSRGDINNKYYLTPEQSANAKALYEAVYWRATIKVRQAQKRATYKRKRLKVLKRYGTICQCCGEDRYQFLSIDHIKGGGTKHRKEIGWGENFTSWLVRNNFPEGYQVLCHNCNQAKTWYGGCPHKLETVES